VKVLGPVRVEDGVTLDNVSLGPNVSIDSGAVIRGSSLRDTLVGRQARIVNSRLEECLVGDGADVQGQTLKRMIITRDESTPAP
jgi:glucose-1-phosphate thymidylyltransferase